MPLFLPGPRMAQWELRASGKSSESLRFGQLDDLLVGVGYRQPPEPDLLTPNVTVTWTSSDELGRVLLVRHSDWGTWGFIGGAVEIDERSRRGASAHRLEAMCRSRGWEVASYRPAGQLGWGVHNEDERGLFRQAAGRVLAGHGLMTIAKDWNHRGVLERRVKLGRRRRYESCCSPPASPGCASTLLIGRGGSAAA